MEKSLFLGIGRDRFVREMTEVLPLADGRPFHNFHDALCVMVYIEFLGAA